MTVTNVAVIVDARRRLADRRKQLVNGGAALQAPNGQTQLATRPSTSPSIGKEGKFSSWDIQPDSWSYDALDGISAPQPDISIDRSTPTLTQRIREAQHQRRQSSGYRKTKGSAMATQACLPLLDAAVRINDFQVYRILILLFAVGRGTPEGW